MMLVLTLSFLIHAIISLGKEKASIICKKLIVCHKRRVPAPAGLMDWPKITHWDLITNHSPNLVLSAMKQSCFGLRKRSRGCRGTAGNGKRNQNPPVEEGKRVLDKTSHQGKQLPELRSLPMVSGVMQSLSWAAPNCNTFGLVVGFS